MYHQPEVERGRGTWEGGLLLLLWRRIRVERCVVLYCILLYWKEKKVRWRRVRLSAGRGGGGGWEMGFSAEVSCRSGVSRERNLPVLAAGDGWRFVSSVRFGSVGCNT